MLIQKQVKDILKEVAAESGLPIDTVTDIYLSEFGFVVDEMKKGEKNDPDSFSNILLKYFGTFKISRGKIHYMSQKEKEDDK